MQKGFSIILILIVGALIGLVLGGVYFYNQSKLVPQSLLNNTTEWRIYNDPDQFFSLQYPGNWKIEYSEPGNLENIKDKKDVSFKGKEGKVEVHWTQSYGGGCDPQYHENINFAGETVDVCHTIDEATKIENYNGLYKTLDKNNLGVFLGVEVNPPEKNREAVFKVLSSFKFKEMFDETAKWKTYTDPLKVYTFKYPDNWGIEGPTKYNIETPSKPGIVFVFKDKSGDDYGFHAPKISFRVDEGNGKSLQELIDDSATIEMSPPYDIKKETITLAGTEWFKYSASRQGYEPLTQYVTVKGAKIFRITVSRIEEGESEVNQVLSTFKFLE